MSSKKPGADKAASTEDRQPKAGHPAKAGDRPNTGDRDVGVALRAVYQDAVSETIPDEMLDLLNQLG